MLRQRYYAMICFRQDSATLMMRYALPMPARCRVMMRVERYAGSYARAEDDIVKGDYADDADSAAARCARYHVARGATLRDALLLLLRALMIR